MTALNFKGFNQPQRSMIQRWGWAALTTAVALILLFAPLPLPDSAPQDRVLRIEASMYQFTPAEWQINPGDRVTIELVSTDVVHGFSLDGYNLELKAEPGQIASATFIANRSGLFHFRCSVPCGNLHPFMLGKLQVGPNLLLIRGLLLGVLGVIAAMLSMQKAQVSSLRQAL